MESEGEEEAGDEGWRWEVSWFDSPSPVRAPWPWANSGRDRPASTAGSPGTLARIESDDGQDSRHAGEALCPTHLTHQSQAACGAQSLPYGARTRRLFSNFATTPTARDGRDSSTKQ